MMSAKLDEDYKRGRPDILHIALLNALATPLYIQNHLRVFIHTFDNNVILVGKNVRFPKSYFRFEGLMLNLFRDKKIVSEDGRRKIADAHPDRGGSHDQAARLTAARDTLLKGRR